MKKGDTEFLAGFLIMSACVLTCFVCGIFNVPIIPWAFVVAGFLIAGIFVSVCGLIMMARR